MKTKKSYVKPLLIIILWAFIVNIVIEFMLIFILMSTPLDHYTRIVYLIKFFETCGRRNYANTISVIPDELVGTWVFESSTSDEFQSLYQVTMTKLVLRPDQTFEIEYPENLIKRGVTPNIPQKYANPYPGNDEMIFLRGKWGTVSHTSSFFRPADTTLIYGRYEGENEYVSLGQVLDRHVSSPQNRFVIKWFREVDETHLTPGYGVYLKKSSENFEVQP